MLAHRTFTSSGVHYRKGKSVSIHACSLLHFLLFSDLNDAPFNSERLGTKSPSRGKREKGEKLERGEERGRGEHTPKCSVNRYSTQPSIPWSQDAALYLPISFIFLSFGHPPIGHLNRNSLISSNPAS